MIFCVVNQNAMDTQSISSSFERSLLSMMRRKSAKCECEGGGDGIIIVNQ